MVRHLCRWEKYGFNTMTTRTFITDQLKSWFIALLVGIPVLGLITWSIINRNGFWLFAWGLITSLPYSSISSIQNGSSRFLTSRLPSLRVRWEQRSKLLRKRQDSNWRIFMWLTVPKEVPKPMHIFQGLAQRRGSSYMTRLSGRCLTKKLLPFLLMKSDIIRGNTLSETWFPPFFLPDWCCFSFSCCRQPPAFGRNGSGDLQFSFGTDSIRILYSPLSLYDRTIHELVSRKNEFEADKFVYDNYEPGSLPLHWKSWL